MKRLTTKTKRRLIVLAVLLVGAACGFLGLRHFRDVQRARLAEDRRDEGMRAYLDGDYETALEPLSFALSREKSDVELLIAFADTRSKIPELNSRHITEAINLYNAALRIEPDNRVALQKLLDLYESARIGEIRDYYDTAVAILKTNPDHLQARSAVARYHQAQRELPKAIAELEKLQELDPGNIEWRIRHITALADQGAAEPQRLAKCDQWIAAWEGDGRMLFIKAILLLDIGRREEAAAIAVKAADAGIESPEVHHGLVMLLDDLDMPTVADALVERAKTEFPGEAWVWDEAIRRPWLQRELQAALTELEEAKSQFTVLAANLLKWDVLVNLLLDRHEETERALAALRERAKTVDSPEDRDSLRAWAEALDAFSRIEESKWSDVRAAFERAIMLAPNDAILSYILGEAYSEVAEYDLAADSYNMARRLEPDWLAAGIAYGNTLLRLGRPHDAMSAAVDMGMRGDRIVTPVVPLFVRSWLDMCRSFGSIDQVEQITSVTLGEVTATLERFRASVDMNEAPDLIEMLYDAYRLSDDSPGARAISDDVLAMGEEAAAPLLLTAARGSAMAGIGHEEELLRRAEQKAPFSVEAAETRAWLLLRNGDADAGLAVIDDARAAAKSGPAFEAEQWDRMRALYLIRADHPEAIDALNRLLDQYPKSSDLPGLILAQSDAWVSKQLVQRAIAAQRARVGDRSSTRLLLAEASFTLLFDSENNAAVADAIDRIRRALEMSPRSLAALTLMADALLKTNPPQYRDAIRFLEQAATTYPSRIDLYPKIISLYQQINDYNAAGEWLDRLAQRDDLSDDLKRIELALLDQQGDFSRAIERLTSRGALSEAADKLSLASLYVRTGRFTEAEDIVDELLAEPDHNEMAIRFAAEFYSITDRLAEGVALLESRPADGGAGAKDARIGSLYRRAGRFEEALASLRTAVNLEPQNAAYFNELATTYLRTGEYDAARRAAKEGLAIEPSHSGLLSNFALASLDADERARTEAIAMLNPDDPQHAALIDTLRLFERIDGMNPSARDLQEASRLVEQYPHFMPAARLAVNLYVVAGQLEGALTLAEAAINRHPNDASPCEWATDIALRLAAQNRGSLERALEFAEKWRRRSPAEPMPADIVMGQICLQQGRAREAARHFDPYFEQIVTEWEDDRIRAFAAVRALLGDSQFERVTRALQPLLERHQVWRDAWISITAAMDEPVAERMIEHLEQFLLESPEGKLTIADAWSRHGRRSGDSSHFERARHLADEAMKQSSQVEIPANLLLGSTAEAQQRNEDAERHYLRVLELDPDNVYALNNLAYLLSKNEANAARARNLSGRAIELQPGVPAFLDTHAVVLLRLGETSEAEIYARRAVEADPNEAEYKITLAEILLRGGKFAEAMTVAESALTLIEQIPRFDQTLADRAADLLRRISDAQAAVRSD